MSIKKLQLNKETLRFLSPKDLDWAAGINVPSYTCPSVTCPSATCPSLTCPPRTQTCRLSCYIICDLK
jgi:hypothetical protein